MYVCIYVCNLYVCIDVYTYVCMYISYAFGHYISIDMLLTLHSIHSFPATKEPRNTIAVIIVFMRLAV